MGSKQELIDGLEGISRKVDFGKLKRLSELVAELKTLDELLAHNAETALEQQQQKAESNLDVFSSNARKSILELLPRVDADTLTVSLHLLRYQFPASVVLLLHIHDLLEEKSDIPVLRQGIAEHFQTLIRANPDMHIVLLSHDSADVTAILASVLAGNEAIASGQVSMIYESGMGLYIGTPTKEKKDVTQGMRAEVLHIMERMAIAAATRMRDGEFHDKFYFSSSEYSVGIRVHPFARGLSNTLDADAAHELISCLAVALADLVKEDVKAVHAHIMNYFLRLDPRLSVVFSQSVDERVWDVEKVDEYLSLLQLVHLGARGSVIRPADSSDVQAAQAILDKLGSNHLLVTAGDSHFTLPLMQWTREQQFGLVACSESAEEQVRQAVEQQGGIQYSAASPHELFRVLDAYNQLSKIVR